MRGDQAGRHSCTRQQSVGADGRPVGEVRDVGNAAPTGPVQDLVDPVEDRAARIVWGAGDLVDVQAPFFLVSRIVADGEERRLHIIEDLWTAANSRKCSLATFIASGHQETQDDIAPGGRVEHIARIVGGALAEPGRCIAGEQIGITLDGHRTRIPDVLRR